MTDLENVVRTRFDATVGRPPSHIVQAPGRVNLIGEHTDYNDGFVLPCAIDFRTVVAAARRDDGLIRAVAVDFDGDEDTFDVAAGVDHDHSRQWPNYVRGVVASLLRRGLALGGADLVITGNIPQRAGLSSSASLEVAVAEALRQLYALPLSGIDLALIGQEAENDFVGCQCGIMDQMISVCGKRSNAMLLDCRSLDVVEVAIPARTSVVIVDSNKPRGLVDSAYNERRQQCEAAARFFGVTALRDVTEDEFARRSREMDEVVARRARHVVSENARTLRAADALRSGDLAAMSRLMAESHASMRDDFQITVPEIDFLVEIMQAVLRDRGGVRMTGGGFGGCVVALVPDVMVAEVVDRVRQQYAKHTALGETIHVCEASDGAGVVTRPA